MKLNQIRPGIMNEIFSENFSRKENLLTMADARIKILFVTGAIFAVLSSHDPLVSFIVIFLAVAALFNIRIPLRLAAIRLSAPLGVAITVSFVKIFLFHQSPADGVLAMSKIISSTSLVLFLSMTTSVDKLLAACRWFKVPATWVEICLIAYRYIFVLLEDATTVLDAQKVRLGYSTLAHSLCSIGTLSGAIIIRAYDQSIATYEAMMLRGYKGKMEAPSLRKRLTLKDAGLTFVFIAILAFLTILNWFYKI